MNDFDQDYTETELHKLARELDRSVKIYVIGGGAMAFRDQKEGTKDIDVILETEDEADALAEALQAIGYEKPSDIDKAYQRMGARRILENEDGFRWDIFVRNVLGFQFSERMMARAEAWLQDSELTVVAASTEDLFTFKALTDRPRDRDDMAVLWAAEPDTDTIREEVLAQAENRAGKRFAAFFYKGLRAFVEQEGAVFPDIETFERLYEREMLAELMETRLQDGPVSITELVDEGRGRSEEVVRDAARRLERQGLAELDGDVLHGSGRD